MIVNECITIIVPVYQSAGYIGKCLDSIIAQTYPDIQIIVVDDGSTDGTGEICDEYARKYDNIEVVHTSNNGPVRARWEGLNKAKGKYVGFVDSDDYVSPEMFEGLYSEIIESDADFVHSWFKTIENGEEKYEIAPYADCIEVNNDVEKEEVIIKLFFEKGKRLSPSMWSKLYRRDFAIANYRYIPETLKYGEDVLFLFACIANSKKIKIVSDVYYNYIVRENSLSHIDDKAKMYNEIGLLCYLENLNEKLEYPISREYFFEWFRSESFRFLNRAVNGGCGSIRENQFYIKDINRYKDKSIAIYGMGMVGRDYLEQMDLLGLNPPVALFDNLKKDLFWGKIKIHESSEDRKSVV